MELICPSCEARYQLPDGAISEKGRQVSCMSCGHGWHAYPPLVLSESNRAGMASSPIGIPFGTPPGGAPAAGAKPPRQVAPSRPMPGQADKFETAAAEPQAAATSSSRTQQLAEIREMLAEVQAEDHTAPTVQRDTPLQDDSLTGPAKPRAAALADADRPASNAPEETMGRDPIDPLEERAQNRPNKTEKAKPVDLKSIRRRHDRKERARQREKSMTNGAFLTGFLLVVIIVAVLIGLYVLHPAIISKLPGTEQALNEYVATIDSFRVSIAETVDQARRWLMGG